jgi:hypothetical protein
VINKTPPHNQKSGIRHQSSAKSHGQAVTAHFYTTLFLLTITLIFNCVREGFAVQLNKNKLFRPAGARTSQLVMFFAFLNLPHWQLLCFLCHLHCITVASKTTAARVKRACWSLRVTATFLNASGR